uniref:Uncharacterized protein n=1 Tax=Arundo donax TaxID=35708 RepID=A0A0A9C1F6_ARUDO
MWEPNFVFHMKVIPSQRHTNILLYNAFVGLDKYPTPAYPILIFLEEPSKTLSSTEYLTKLILSRVNARYTQ